MSELHEEPQASTHRKTPDGAATAQAVVQRGLVAARATAIIPVIVLALAALAAFAYATYVFGDLVRGIFEHPLPAGDKIGLFLRVVDVFLIGTTFLIVAIGLYELFLTRQGARETAHLPHWLEITDLNDLKTRVISMIVLVVAVTFVEAVVSPQPGTRILDLGIAVAVVVVALTAFVRLSERR